MSEFEKLHNSAFGFYDGRDSRNNVVCFIEKNARTKADEIAFRWPDPMRASKEIDSIDTNIPHQGISFKAFYEIVRRTANGLQRVGIKPGDRVILFVPMSLYLYSTMAAIQTIGASAVFLDSWARRAQLGASARVVQANAMISFEQAFLLCQEEPDLQSVPIKIVVGPHKGAYTATLEQLQTSPTTDEIKEVAQDDTALITFTTGSSGTPKGANRIHCFLASQHYALNKCIPYGSSDIDLPAFPIFSLNNLAVGVTTIIPFIDIGRPSDKDPLLLVSQMLGEKVTCATLSPSMIVGIARFCAEKNLTLPLVRRLITGGAPVSNDTLALLKKAVPNAEVWVLYGSTEVEPIAHIEAKDILFPKHGGSAAGEGVNVGHIVEGLEYKFIAINKGVVKLANDDWAPFELKLGEIGELVVSGLHVCKSYYNDPDAVTKTKIIESSGKVWHRTGDVAFLDKNHNLWLVGRVHNVISRAGKLLFPVKVEILLKKHPAVLQAAFVGIEDKELGEKPYALVTLNESGKTEPEKVLQEIKIILDENNVQYDFLGVIDEIPMDPRHHSKVEYTLLREQIMKK